MNHKCYLVSTLNKLSSQSNTTFKIKETCSLCNTTTFTTTYAPIFTGAIPLGAAGVSSTF